MTKVTYTPLENGDPIETSMTTFDKGIPTTHVFLAGKPVDIPDSVFIDGIERVVSIDEAGNERGRGVAKKIKLIDQLRTNPYFHVDGTKQATLASKGGRPRVPKTPEEYRSYALAWFMSCETPDELVQRWENEADLRDRLSVHDDGDVIKYLRPFYDAHFDKLKKAAA